MEGKGGVGPSIFSIVGDARPATPLAERGKRFKKKTGGITRESYFSDGKLKTFQLSPARR